MDNNYLFDYLHGLTGQNLVFDGLVVVFARYFQYIVIAYAVILMYRTLTRRDPDLNPRLYFKKAFNEGFWISSSVIFAYLITAIMKVSFAIPRPFLSGVQSLFLYGGYNSFPSGHATIFAALTVSMFLFHRRRGWWFFFSALAIGVARVIAGVHYPIDIIVGYLVGTVCSYIVCILLRPVLNKYITLFD